MKKFYIAAAAALLSFGFASADILTFFVGENQVTPGEKYIFNHYEWEDYGDGEGSYTIDPDVSLLTTESGNATITAESLSGQDIQLCAGGMCQTGKKVVKSVDLSANQKLPLLFDIMGYVESGGEKEVPTVLARLTAALGDEEVSFTIEMGPNAAVRNVFVDDHAFMLTADGINYNVNGTATASLYDLNGRQVFAAPVSGQGTISTTGLAAGVYVYKLAGSVNRTGKMYVK